ncbi:MAG: pirin family protein [Bacteroidetes bacterium]|nr:pirin family protein [Bacteroidota bacterium]
MIPQSKAKIFLADERGHSEMDWFRSYNTFNFGQYQQEHKQPFGALYVCNDDTLAAGRSISWLVEEDTQLLLLPLAGILEFKDSLGNHTVLEAGDCCYCVLPAGASFQLINPCKDELIRFMHCWCRSEKSCSVADSFNVSFDLQEVKNSIIPLMQNQQAVIKAGIGLFDGRAEAVYHLKDKKNGLFVLVIDGAFEVQYRLLHAGDALALWEMDEVELEALSNNALILLLEVPLFR